MTRAAAIAVISVALAACSGAREIFDGGTDAGTDAGLDGGTDAGVDGGTDAGFDGGELDGGGDAGSDAGFDGGCFLTTTGVFGSCISTTDCAAMANYQSTPGYCPGPADIECCTKVPSVSDNPPVPSGWKLMMQSQVTTEMTNWAVMILHDPVDYPMFSTTIMSFTIADGGTLQVMARVEWHPPDFQNNTVHRGVTLYEPG